MNLRQELTQASRNLLRNKRRSLVTGLAILSGFVGLSLLAGYVARVERYLMVNSVYLNHAGHIAIYKKEGLDRYYSKPARYLLSPEEMDQAKAALKEYQDDIDLIAPYLMANGLVQVGTKSFPFQGKGLTYQAEVFTRSHPLVEKWTRELRSNETMTNFADTSNITNPVKLTYKLFENLGKNKEVQLQGLTVDSGFNAMEATVTTLYSSGLEMTEDTSMQTTLPVFQELMATDGATYLGVYLKKDIKTRWLTYQINNLFTEKKLNLEAHPFLDDRIGLFYTGTMNFLYAMAAFFFSLVSMVVVLSIANAISMNIMERIRELGTMRAMGFTPGDLSRLIALESFVLATISLVIGFVVAQAVCYAVNAANIRFFPPGIAGDMQFVLTPWPSICLILALPLLVLSVVTAYIVTKRKVRGEVSTLLTESTT